MPVASALATLSTRSPSRRNDLLATAMIPILAASLALLVTAAARSRWPRNSWLRFAIFVAMLGTSARLLTTFIVYETRCEIAYFCAATTELCKCPR